MVLVVQLAASLMLPTLAGAQDPSNTANGGRIYAMSCNNCHNLRPPTEFDDEEWTVIVNHMRTRADLTKSEAEAVAAFLRTANTNDAGRQTSAIDRPGTTDPVAATDSVRLIRSRIPVDARSPNDALRTTDSLGVADSLDVTDPPTPTP